MWPLFDIWLWNLVRLSVHLLCILNNTNPDIKKAVLEINFALVILMQIVAAKVLHKGFQSKWLWRGVCERQS